MNQEEKIEWLEQHGFEKYPNLYVEGKCLNKCLTDYDLLRKELLRDEFLSLKFQLRVQLKPENGEVYVFLDLVTIERETFLGETPKIIVKNNCRVNSAEELKALIDKTVEESRVLSEKVFGRLLEYRMTGM